MRINEPVTQREHVLPAGLTLVSVTDLKGRITYCNPAFVQASGFAREELLGQPHNIVRHPDMPEEAFRDLWATIQAGLPWTGVVKNRRKNGDHYWVQASATPMRDGPRITGFLSVRTVPERVAVEAAQALYARMREEERQGRRMLALHRGRLRRTDPWGRVLAAFRPGQAGRIVALQAAAAALVAGGSSMAPAGAWAVAVPVAAAASWLLWRQTMAPLRPVLADAHVLASGDLAHRVDTGAEGVVGELQQALMQLSVNLRAAVSDARAGVQQANQASVEIAAGNADLAARTESQAGSLQQTAASMEQITGTVSGTADAAAQGATLATSAAEVARHSHEAVQAVVQTMDGITASSRRIEEIIQVVEGVAFQTNILALNAAVEAARAGEAGRGFAVVAAEVRSLASNTTAAAREVRQLIGESAQRVASGSVRSAEARERMDEALRSVAALTRMLEGIRTGAAQQQQGIAQVNEAVTHMDAITQQNAAMVEQLAVASRSLQGQVESVRDSMRLFRLAPGEATAAELDAVELRRAARRAAEARAAPAPARAGGPDGA